MKPEIQMKIPLSHPWGERFWAPINYADAHGIRGTLTIEGVTQEIRLINLGAPHYSNESAATYIHTDWRAYPIRSDKSDPQGRVNGPAR